jgi:hypothetical protein
MSRHTSPPGSGDGIVAGQISAPKVAGQPLPNVRFGSEADIRACPRDVRFTPKSGHSLARLLVGLDASNT